jgi:hypothetical protein
MSADESPSLRSMPIVFGTRLAKEASLSFPPGGGRLGWGEKLGRSAPLMCTPTPPSPVEGEGPAPRLTITFVPNSIEIDAGRVPKDPTSDIW